jgi:hypothetical protein
VAFCLLVRNGRVLYTVLVSREGRDGRERETMEEEEGLSFVTSKLEGNDFEKKNE